MPLDFLDRGIRWQGLPFPRRDEAAPVVQAAGRFVLLGYPTLNALPRMKQ